MKKSRVRYLDLRALILVDLQNDFCPGGALAVPQGDRVVPVANRLLEAAVFELVVATQDWHPRHHGSFAVNHPGRSVGETVVLEGLEQILWPVHCVQGTPGAELVSTLKTGFVEKIFHKGTDPRIDSYSTFFDNAKRRSTGLEKFLRKQAVESVYLLGLATDYCVKYSALNAARLGFQTRVVTDGCRGIDLQEGDVERAFREMEQAGVRFVLSSDLIIS